MRYRQIKLIIRRLRMNSSIGYQTTLCLKTSSRKWIFKANLNLRNKNCKKCYQITLWFKNFGNLSKVWKNLNNKEKWWPALWTLSNHLCIHLSLIAKRINRHSETQLRTWKAYRLIPLTCGQVFKEPLKCI